MLFSILLGQIGWPQILLIVGIVLLLFGGRKIPELMKGMGRGVREFKDGMKGEGDESSAEEKRKIEK